MVRGPDFSRELRRGEEPAVEALLCAAFGGEDELRLVRALRRDGAMAGEMVLPLGGKIVGYYALSHFERPKGWLCLAPVAIHPDLQRQRNGQRMMGLLTEWARITGTYVVVLGEPAFYTRCGFSLERARNLTLPYPLAHTLLAGPGADAPTQTLQYPRAFKGL